MCHLSKLQQVFSATRALAEMLKSWECRTQLYVEGNLSKVLCQMGGMTFPPDTTLVMEEVLMALHALFLLLLRLPGRRIKTCKITIVITPFFGENLEETLQSHAMLWCQCPRCQNSILWLWAKCWESCHKWKNWRPLLILTFPSKTNSNANRKCPNSNLISKRPMTMFTLIWSLYRERICYIESACRTNKLKKRFVFRDGFKTNWYHTSLAIWEACWFLL